MRRRSRQTQIIDIGKTCEEDDESRHLQYKVQYKSRGVAGYAESYSRSKSGRVGYIGLDAMRKRLICSSKICPDQVICASSHISERLDNGTPRVLYAQRARANRADDDREYQGV